jgi:hypothetical protein
MTFGSLKKNTQNSAKIIDADPSATQITDTGSGANTEAIISAKPAAREGKINGYPSFRMDI